jgi:citrate lyase beta subunit
VATWNIEPYRDLIEQAERGRRVELDKAASLKANLPVKYLQQQAHFTTPASNYDMLVKAVESGLSSSPKILAKLGIADDELADALGVTLRDVEQVLASDGHSPFVMVDGEDAQALRDDVVTRGRDNAVRVFREADWRRTLRFYRPSGLSLPYCVEDIVGVLTHAGQGRAPEDYPIDGVVWPKVEHPSQIAWVCDTLGAIEERLGLPENRIKLEFLVESGWALAQLPEIARACVSRLAGIIFGIADFSADILLPEIVNDHPVCDWARMEIVNLAGSIGVPSIDNMTVRYPVADASLSPADNKKRVLSRLKECFDDARHGERLGMDGKWVGHPLQLFVVLLAYRTALPEAEVAAEVAKIEAYEVAVRKEIGATIIEGIMSDRATDRHARIKLRKAIAIGRLSPDKGLELGVLTAEEARSMGLS